MALLYADNRLLLIVYVCVHIEFAICIADRCLALHDLVEYTNLIAPYMWLIEQAITVINK